MGGSSGLSRDRFIQYISLDNALRTEISYECNYCNDEYITYKFSDVHDRELTILSLNIWSIPEKMY